MEINAHCKINLGLHVLRRRDDGFHDIETVMVPVRGLFDTVSVAVVSAGSGCEVGSEGVKAMACSAAGSMLEVIGNEVDCPPEKNICMHALRLIQCRFGVGEAAIRLRKIIPSGAGLGGGSSDAAAVLYAMNEEFALKLPDTELERLAAELGSDVPFFVRNSPQLCTGRGEIMTPVNISFSGLWLAILKPPCEVSTVEAYSGIEPRESKSGVSRIESPLSEIIAQPVSEWRGLLVNDFEKSVFARHPEIGDLKSRLYYAGAMYASMSGSGSAVFGIFDRQPSLENCLRDLENCAGSPVFVHVERLES